MCALRLLLTRRLGPVTTRRKPLSMARICGNPRLTTLVSQLLWIRSVRASGFRYSNETYCSWLRAWNSTRDSRPPARLPRAIRGVLPDIQPGLGGAGASPWSAIIPTAPLRRWRLVEIGQGETLLTSSLRIDERILHYLTGLSYVDERLAGLVDLVKSEGAHCVVPTHQLLVDRIAAFFSKPNPELRRPHVQLCGEDGLTRRAIAVAASERLDGRLYRLALSSLPAAPQELDMVLRLWTREAVLTRNILLIEHEGTDASEVGRGSGTHYISRWSQRAPYSECPANVGGWDMLIVLLWTWRLLLIRSADNYGHRRLVMGIDDAERHLEAVSRQFHISASVIQAAGLALDTMDEERDGQLLIEQEQADRLWEICRRQARPRLDELAQRIEPSATWEDLVLPEPQRGPLREITMHVRHRHTVYETWGFAAKGSRGLGVSALFAGARNR